MTIKLLERILHLLYFFDSQLPTIIHNPNSKLKTDNTTILSGLLTNLTLNLTCSDNNIETIYINFSNTTGIIEGSNTIYINLTDNLLGTSFNLTDSINISQLLDRNYTIDISCGDDLAAPPLKNYKVVKNSDEEDVFYLLDK